MSEEGGIEEHKPQPKHSIVRILWLREAEDPLPVQAVSLQSWLSGEGRPHDEHDTHPGQYDRRDRDNARVLTQSLLVARVSRLVA